jgi:hypothetical protein
MFGMPAVAGFINSGNNGTAGPFTSQPHQVRGFGFLHDGSVDTLFRFHNAAVFNSGFGGSTAAANTLRRQVEQFVLAFDTDFAPVVGQQVTLTSTNSATAGPRIDLLIARAALNECDLVVKGNRGGVTRGAVRQSNGLFKTDRASDAQMTDAQVRSFAATPGQEITYTCVPPGSGTRIGIDRDLDGCLDQDDLDPTNPAVCSGVGTTTTSTTTPAGSTTTTTNPQACTPVPVTDPKAHVIVVARNEAGKVSATMQIALAGYHGEPVTATLTDSDSPSIATQTLATLPPSGSSGKKWRFKSTLDGLQNVQLKDLSPRKPGQFKLNLKAKHWFSSADANQPAAVTFLTVQVGNVCFTHVTTKKTD